MATLSLPQLSLNLPSTRISVNFDNFTANINPTSTPNPNLVSIAPLARKPVPTTNKQSRRHGYLHGLPLSEVTEESEHKYQPLGRHDSGVGLENGTEKWNPDQLFQSVQNAYGLSRTASPAPSTSSSSSNAESIFSRVQSTSTVRTPSPISFRSKKSLGSFREEPLNISSLPISLLEHILSYVLPVTQTISIGPLSMEHRHMQYRYHRPSLEYMDVRQALQHPLFAVSHHIRTVAIDLFYQKCTFAIDLASIYYTKVSSTVDENMKRQRKFWIDDPPKLVEESLQKITKLHIRLPVPSTEAGVRRGREEDEWMDGSDGKGGGNWRVNSIKKEQGDAQSVQECLDTITKLLTTSPNESLQRTRSFGRQRSRSRGRRSGRSTESSDVKRAPLKRLEIVLVKRSPWALIQPEVLDFVRTLRTLQVTGFMEYFFELNGQQAMWARKYRHKWKGMEPDSARLLQDLQSLTVAEKPIEPICTPVEFRFVDVDKSGRLGLVESALPKTPIVLDQPKRTRSLERDLPPIPATPRSVLRNPLSLFGKKNHKRADSYTMIMAEGMNSGSKGNQPPTIEELQKIAADIRNGLY